MYVNPDLAKDGAQLALGFSPLAFLATLGSPALLLSLLNIIVLAGLRIYDLRLRSRERFELARLQLEFEATKQTPLSSTGS